MTGLAAVRARIKTVLDGVAGMGRTHDYLRWIEDEKGLSDQFVVGGLLHVWMISLDTADFYDTRRFPANHEQSVYRFSIHGFMALKDASATEKTFVSLVDAVFAAFRADKKLGNTVIESGPLVGAEGGHRMFAGVLCHYVRLVLPVREQTEP